MLKLINLLKTPALERYLRLKVLNFIVKPARNFEHGETIAATEEALDKTTAKAFKTYLNKMGFTSCVHSNRYGFFHFYDSAPHSSETPIILLHGLGSSAQSFAMVGLLLAEQRRVIMPDLFHFAGFSEANNGFMNFSDHVKSISEFLDFLQVGAVDFCGLSLGGWIGMRIASLYPEKINSLALLNPGGIRVGVQQLQNNLLYLSWKRFQTMYPDLLRVFPYAGLPIFSNFSKRALYRLLKNESVRSFVKTVRSLDFVDEDLPYIKTKTLLLWGQKDGFLSSQIPQIITSNISHIESYFVRDCAHVLSIESPLTVTKKLQEFYNLDVHQSLTWKTLSMIFSMHKLEKIKQEKQGVRKAS